MKTIAIQDTLKNVVVIIKEIAEIVSDNTLSQLCRISKEDLIHLSIYEQYEDITKELCNDMLNDINTIEECAKNNNINIEWHQSYDNRHKYWLNFWLYKHNYDNQFIEIREKLGINI